MRLLSIHFIYIFSWSFVLSSSCIPLRELILFGFFVSAWGQSSGSRLGVVVEAKNFTLPAGTTAVLPCHSPRMVWTRDRLKDRQRVLHWDLIRSSPDYSAERVLDMSPGARQRVYNSFNKGRISVPDSAFNDGNFSLVINSKVFFPLILVSLPVSMDFA